MAQTIPSLVIGLGGTGALTVRYLKEELLNIYDNKIPETAGLLVFDTAREPLAQFEKGVKTRREGEGAGAIELAAREYGHIGGSAETLLKRAKNSDDPSHYLGSWLLSDHYLEETPKSLWKLEDGAGQFRQFGRLALFNSVAAPNQSQLYNRLNERISTLSGYIQGERSLQVFIIGSLAGGTGAGLFLDVAYLVRRIANKSVQVRGFFYLPEAFQATLGANEVVQARSRSFAALRELGRFTTFRDFDLGYPMHYHASRATDNAELWHNTLHEKLYDLTYLIDGDRPSRSLTGEPLWRGAAPSVSDAILSFMDSSAGEYHRAYVPNINQKIDTQRGSEGYVPYVGGLGAYTIMIPIQQMVDAWSYKLSLEALEELLQPAEKDDSTGIPTSLSERANRERSHAPDEEVANLMSGSTPIVDPRSGDSIQVPSFWRDVATWAGKYSDAGSQYTNVLARMDSEQWMQILQPAAMDSGPDINRARRRADKALQVTVESEIALSHEMDPEADPANDHRRIQRDVTNLFDKYLGVAGSDGQREGGMFRTALRDFSEFQMNRFYNGMEAYVVGQLTGQDSMRANVARQGKLGWLLAVIANLRQVLNDALLLLKDLENNNTQLLRTRQSRTSAMNDAAKLMEQERTNTGGMFRNPLAKTPAQEAQVAFREAAQDAFDMERAGILRSEISRLLDRMLEFVVSIQSELKKWEELLARHHNGLYADVRRRREQVLTQLNKSESLPSRRLIVEERWREDTYAKYRTDDVYQELMSSFRWDASQTTDRQGNPAMHITFSIGDAPLREDKTGEWSIHNTGLLTQHCREIFAPARERESILNYLATKYRDNAEELAQEVYERSAALTKFDKVEAKGYESAVYVVVNPKVEFARDETFLGEFMAALRGRFGVAETDETMARQQAGDDRFRMTIVGMAELLPMPTLNAYRQAEREYSRLSTIRRQLTHIFPAEVRVVPYEDRLQRELNQARRWVSDRVAILMEDIGRFRSFHELMAHDIVVIDADPDVQNERLYSWFLFTAPLPDSNEAEEMWYLTESSRDPSLLEAMYTYIFREGDHGRQKHIPGFTKQIDYDHVQNYLYAVRAADTDDRSANYQDEERGLAIYNQDLYDLLVQYEEGSPEFNVLARLITEHDMLKTHSHYLEEKLAQVENNLKQAKSVTEEGRNVNRKEERGLNDLYDLFSLSLVVVRQMVEERRKDAYLAMGYTETNIPPAQATK